MTMKTYISHLCLIIALLVMTSGCGSNEPAASEENSEVKTPVTITNVSIEPMQETIDLNAVSSYMKKNTIKSVTVGLVESIEINPGDHVKKGALLFTLKTKEAVALEKNSYSDTILKGIIKINSTKDGIISTISHHKGDYVQEGDELAVIAEQGTLVFMLEVPFELHQYIKMGGTCMIMLADSRQLKGTISSSLPAMDIQSQTESYIVKPLSTESLPENLIAKIKIVKSVKAKATTLPKPAILSNETLSDFWVMKLINDSTAVKVSIKKGMESSDKVEVLDPPFKNTDRILLTGNYGMSDTAKVFIEKKN